MTNWSREGWPVTTCDVLLNSGENSCEIVVAKNSSCCSPQKELGTEIRWANGWCSCFVPKHLATSVSEMRRNFWVKMSINKYISQLACNYKCLQRKNKNMMGDVAFNVHYENSKNKRVNE